MPSIRHGDRWSREPRRQAEALARDSLSARPAELDPGGTWPGPLLSAGQRRVLLRRAQRQSQRMHATRFHLPELPRQRDVHGAGPCHAGDAAERLADHQNMIMGLAYIPLASASPRPHMTGVMRAIVSHGQHRRRERGGQRDDQAVSAISLHRHS